MFSALFPPLDGHFRRLREFASRAGYEDWFQRWVDVEREATALCSWEQSIVYGLLQTREYARAILRAARPDDTDDQIEQQTEARMERQEILARENPPFIWICGGARAATAKGTAATASKSQRWRMAVALFVIPRTPRAP